MLGHKVMSYYYLRSILLRVDQKIVPSTEEKSTLVLEQSYNLNHIHTNFKPRELEWPQASSLDQNSQTAEKKSKYP